MISRSPERNTFTMSTYKETLEQDPDDQVAKDMLDYYMDWDKRQQEREETVEWQENNMEYDLRSTDWILGKVRVSDTYAQNLYAAMCNNEFIKLEVINILKNETWSCSWRHAGGVIADMQQKGDYIDWYCSGIGDGLGNGDTDGTKKYVGEGCITEEIRDDLQRLGWGIAPGGDWENFNKE